MQINGPLFERISQNAYRILGLSGNATQADIINSAKKMRSAIKLGKPIKTPWDISFIGNVTREEKDITNALDRLNNPESRLIERLFWFQCNANITKDLSSPTYWSIISKWPDTSDDIVKHDVTLFKLIVTLSSDTDFTNFTQWKDLLQNWNGISQSDEYWDFIRIIEIDGDFDRSAIVDINDVRKSTLPLLIEDIMNIIRYSIKSNNYNNCRAFLDIVSSTDFQDNQSEDIKNQIFEEIESKIDEICDKINKDLKNDIIHEDSPEAIGTNIIICESVLDIFKEKVNPILDCLDDIDIDENEILDSIRETAAICLKQLCESMLWAEQFIEAEEIYYEVLEILPLNSTISRNRIESEECRFLCFSIEKITDDICSECSKKIVRTNNENFIHKNAIICDNAYNSFQRKIDTRLTKLHKLLSNIEPDHKSLLRSHYVAARCLHSIALSYTWANQYLQSKSLLLKAEKLLISTNTFSHEESPELLNPYKELLQNIQASILSVSLNYNNQNSLPNETNNNMFLLLIIGGALIIIPIWAALGLKKDDHPDYQSMIISIIIGIGILIFRAIIINNDNWCDNWISNFKKIWLKYYNVVLWILGIVMTLVLIFSVKSCKDSSNSRSSNDNNTALSSYSETVNTNSSSLNTEKPSITEPINTNNANSNNTPKPSYTKQNNASKNNPISKSIEFQIIDKKNVISTLESKISSIDLQLDDFKNQLSSYKSRLNQYEESIEQGTSIDRNDYRKTLKSHNALVKKYNRFVRERNRIKIKYDQCIDEHNKLIREYNNSN